MKFPTICVGTYDVLPLVSSSVWQTVARGLHYTVKLTKRAIHIVRLLSSDLYPCSLCDFLLVINSNFFHSFISQNTNLNMVLSCTVSDIRRLIGWKLWIFPTPLSGWTLSNFWMNFLWPSLESLGYLWWRFRGPSLRRFDSVPACDGWTDRQTENPTVANRGLCIASYADAL